MTKKRALTAEDAVIIFAIGFALYELAGILASLVMNTESDAYIFVSYALPQIAYISVTAVYIKVRGVEFRLLPRRAEIVPVEYIVAAAMGLAVFFFALLPNAGIQKFFALIGKEPKVTVPLLDDPLSIALGVSIICVLPAIGEELVFRKVFVDGFSEYGEINAVILSGVLFGIGHLNLAQTVHQVFLGCLLSYLYIKTKNISLTAIIHFINNFLALFLTRFTGEEIWNNYTVLGISCAVGAVVLAAGITYLVVKKPRIKNEAKRKPSVMTIGLTVLMSLMWVIAAVIV